jgi:hypothetical protein
MADQVAGHGLGVINRTLYDTPYGGGIVDVTQGNNGIGPFENSDGNTYDVPGFDATTGYDLASGLGTVDPQRLVSALAAGPACSGQSQGGNSEGDDQDGNSQGNSSCGGSQTACNRAMTFAAFSGNLDIRRGESCTLTDSTVDGNINVDTGGSLILRSTTVGGNVNSSGGAASIVAGDDGPTIIEGNVALSNAPKTAATVVCGSQIDGSVSVHGDKGGTVVGVSGATCTAGNTIGRNLDCSSNNPAPTGGGNTVAGNRSGQCAGF